MFLCKTKTKKWVFGTTSPEQTNLKFLAQTMRKLDKNFSMWMCCKKYNYRLSFLYTNCDVLENYLISTNTGLLITHKYKLYTSCFTSSYLIVLFNLKSRYLLFRHPHCNKMKYFSFLKKENSDSKSLLTHKLQNALWKLSALIVQWYSLKAPTCGN